MDKFKISKYIKFFVEGKLPEEKEFELLSWIKQSDENRIYFQKEQERQSLNFASEKENLTRNLDNVNRKKMSVNRKSIKRQFYIRGIAVAAAFILGVISTIAISNYILRDNNKKITQQNIYVPYGAKTKITLPDSSLVWLNSGSSFSYPSEFGETRSVQLTGEAFLEVKKRKIPFVVSTSFGDVEVKGTAFNVHAFPNESFRTTLERGSVIVRNEDNKDLVVLRPGEQAYFEKEQLKVKPVETDLFTSWKEGKLIFRKEYLPVVAKRLERWYNVKIKLDDDKRLNEIWFNGTLEMESFSEVLNLLKITSPIDYSYDKKRRTITIRYKQKQKLSE